MRNLWENANIISIFVKKSIFGQKIRYLVKKTYFWSKNPIFDQNFQFLVKIFDYWSKYPITGQKSDFVKTENREFVKSQIRKS